MNMRASSWKLSAMSRARHRESGLTAEIKLSEKSNREGITFRLLGLTVRTTLETLSEVADDELDVGG